MFWWLLRLVRHLVVLLVVVTVIGAIRQWLSRKHHAKSVAIGSLFNTIDAKLDDDDDDDDDDEAFEGETEDEDDMSEDDVVDRPDDLDSNGVELVSDDAAGADAASDGTVATDETAAAAEYALSPSEALTGDSVFESLLHLCTKSVKGWPGKEGIEQLIRLELEQNSLHLFQADILRGLINARVDLPIEREVKQHVSTQIDACLDAARLKQQQQPQQPAEQDEEVQSDHNRDRDIEQDDNEYDDEEKLKRAWSYVDLDNLDKYAAAFARLLSTVGDEHERSGVMERRARLLKQAQDDRSQVLRRVLLQAPQRERERERLQQCLHDIDTELESAFQQPLTDDNDDGGEQHSLFSLSSSDGVEGDAEPNEEATNETTT